MAEQEVNKEIKTVDIVDFSMQDKLIKVTDAFNTLISDKVVDSIASRKQDVATSMFTNKIEEPSVEASVEEPKIEEPPAEPTETQT